MLTIKAPRNPELAAGVRPPGNNPPSISASFAVLSFALVALLFCPSASASSKLQAGPSTGDLGGIAEVEVPEGFVFADGDQTRELMTSMKNPVSGSEVGLVAPEGGEWFAVYEFEDVGYIPDNEKNDLDAAALLESIRRSNEESNREREKKGWPTMSITGWGDKPHYDEASHNLEWSIVGESSGAPVVNHNTRLLGRRGVMTVTLVGDPSSLPSALPKAKQILAGFSYKEGNKYAEFRQGDKIAAYGLSALVAGGAAAVAVKSGALKGLWKLVVFVAAATGAWLRKVFGKKT